MKAKILLTAFLLTALLASAGPLHVSRTEPVFVTAPDQWQATKFTPPAQTFAYDTWQLTPAGDRNVALLITVFGKDKPKYADREFLKKVLRADSEVYESADSLTRLPIEELPIAGGLGFSCNFVDPQLVGQPVKKGAYKVATPIIISLGSKYLLKATIFCDQTNGIDYQEAIKIVESLKIQGQ